MKGFSENRNPRSFKRLHGHYFSFFFLFFSRKNTQAFNCHKVLEYIMLFMFLVTLPNIWRVWRMWCGIAHVEGARAENFLSLLNKRRLILGTPDRFFSITMSYSLSSRLGSPFSPILAFQGSATEGLKYNLCDEKTTMFSTFSSFTILMI